MRFWVILLTNKRGQKHLPPPLSEVMTVFETTYNVFEWFVESSRIWYTVIYFMNRTTVTVDNLLQFFLFIFW